MVDIAASTASKALNHLAQKKLLKTSLEVLRPLIAEDLCNQATAQLVRSFWFIQCQAILLARRCELTFLNQCLRIFCEQDLGLCLP